MVIIGKVGKPHGVRGWVTIHSFTHPRENILQYQPWLMKQKDGWQPIEVIDVKEQHKSIIVHFANCDDRTIAEQYVNAELGVAREQLPALPDNEFYWSDLTGLTVITTEGRTLGTVDYLFNSGASDVLVIKGDKEYLVPYVMDRVVKNVDLEKKNILVDWDPDF